jgi:hypothetical protein
VTKAATSIGKTIFTKLLQGYLSDGRPCSAGHPWPIWGAIPNISERGCFAPSRN